MGITNVKILCVTVINRIGFEGELSLLAILSSRTIDDLIGCLKACRRSVFTVKRPKLAFTQVFCCRQGPEGRIFVILPDVSQVVQN